jgi:CheY-like chemotaxis protein
MNTRLVNVLLIDDDEVDIMNVKRAFKRNNITNPLYVAQNGIEALAMLRGEPQAEQVLPPTRRVILLDLNMPKMGGLEFLKELRADPDLQYTPVVVLTTSSEERDRVEAYRLNVAGYILKPVTFGNFAEVMATLNNYWALCELPL